jgi:DUF4097 and DUF4098 domain-containing protein YvlB
MDMQKKSPRGLILGVTLLLAGLIGLLAGALNPCAAEMRDEFSWQGQLGAGKTLEIKGINGSIKAEPANNGQIQVKAHKHGDKNDPKQVQIGVMEHSGGVTLCAVYPSNDPGHPNECKPGEGGRMNVKNNDVRVEFEVQVPSGVRFLGRTVNGGIETKSLSSDVEAYTVNGAINITGNGMAQAKTVNGGIQASMGATSWSRPLTFETVNGGVAVTLPSGAQADVDAETVNGSISTDFPLTVQGKFGPKRIQGKIGNGGSSLRMATVNGSIHLIRNP